MTIASHGELELYRGEQSPDSRGHLEAPISEGHKGDGLGLLTEKTKEVRSYQTCLELTLIITVNAVRSKTK